MGRQLGFVAALAMLLGASSAHADVSADDKQKARAAYARASEANERGDYATAARELALADELAPNPVTLKAALEATLDADAAVLGMELVTRAETHEATRDLDSAVGMVRKRFSGRTGRVLVVCPSGTSCTATLDGQALPVAKEQFVLVGKHEAVVSVGGGSSRREVDVKPAALSTVSVDMPVSPGVTASSSGLSPVWFAASLVAMAGTGVGAAISGADTKKQHEAFVSAGCTGPGAGPACNDLATEGQSAQTRTNVLAGVSAALGVTSVVLGVLTFGKKNPPSGPASGLSVEPRKDGAFARLVIVLP